MDYPPYLEWLMASKAPEFLGLVLTRLRPCSKAKAQVPPGPPGPPVKSTNDGGILGRKRWWKAKKNGKKTSFERIKIDFQLIESKKIGEWKWIWTNRFLWIHHSFPNLWPKIPGTASAVSRKSHARNAWHPVGQNLWDPIPWYPKIVG
jgi:hypothetical protein